MRRILIISDEDLYAIGRTLASEGYEISLVNPRFLEETRGGSPDAIFVDVRYFEATREIHPTDRTALITIADRENIGDAIRAIRGGACAYIMRPVGAEDALALVRGATSLPDTVQSGSTSAEMQEGTEIVGESEETESLRAIVRKVAASSAQTILIQGETGTGKNVLAEAIHRASERRGKPFTRIDCTSLAQSIVESELFGYEKGAFTDAKSRHKGLFEVSDGGTVLLDEIGDVPLPLQAKLLEILENRTIRRLGGTRSIRVDIRVIATTNQDLVEAVEEGRFRRDLYHRLRIVPIYIPPLRERREDILPLARHFLDTTSKRLGRPPKSLSPAAEKLLLRYEWPGNVRELRNVLEEICLLEEDTTILPQHLPPEIRETPPEPPKRFLPLAEMERRYVLEVLEATGGNKTKAAEILGISRATLYKRLK
ncbi:MAG: sigma 54-interacting transcriptional regulator [bacterium]